MAAIKDALDIERGLSQLVSAASHYVALGKIDEATQLSDELSSGLQPQNRAYGAMISGVIHSLEGRHAEALDALMSATQLSDFWLVRLELGKAYLRAGSFAEALDEFNTCEARRGEASAVFLDDMPTWRYLADLPYWRARAQQEIGMEHAARENYRVYLEVRVDGALADDARERMTKL